MLSEGWSNEILAGGVSATIRTRRSSPLSTRLSQPPCGGRESESYVDLPGLSCYVTRREMCVNYKVARLFGSPESIPNLFNSSCTPKQIPLILIDTSNYKNDLLAVF
jgi:hypothetical protein